MKTFFSPVVLFLIAALVIAIAASQMPMFKDDAETAPVETAAETTPATEAAIAAATDAATGDVPAAATGTADANGSIPDGSLYGLIAGSADHGTLLGPPCLFPQRWYPELAALSGPQGARRLLQKHAAEVESLPLPQATADIDTPEDYRRLLQDLSRQA
jgi:CTP:molybdopterin cytidylyltransferase MocA